uniref:Uncharacterized protein n=1 Tax=Mus musculus TaxID=10090 RepID=Q9CRD1_MOUSE|nr:unnamed protein product [Mus musculus]BAB30419.1 unnamed protein product [Mus musculus]
MSTGFPSFFAGPCMPTHSPGTAGRSTALEARSYSSMCFQTAKAQEERLQSSPGHKPLPDRSWERGATAGQEEGGATAGQERGGRCQDPGTCQSLRSRIRAQRV